MQTGIHAYCIPQRLRRLTESTDHTASCEASLGTKVVQDSLPHILCLLQEYWTDVLLVEGILYVSHDVGVSGGRRKGFRVKGTEETKQTTSNTLLCLISGRVFYQHLHGEQVLMAVWRISDTN